MQFMVIPKIKYLTLKDYKLNIFLANIFNINKIVEIQLQFRTSELNGILFSVSDPTGYPALSLELYNGKVFKI